MDSDSDFYGDEEVVAGLKARVSSYNPSASALRDLMLTIPRQPIPQAEAQVKPHLELTGKLYNMYEGVRYAWQLHETVDGFLSRLPPSTTPVTINDHWIFIANPWQTASAADDVTGIEDNALLESETNVGIFYRGGMSRLHLFSEFMTETKKAKSRNIAAREINKERAEAVMQILDLAHKLHVRAGKWMLFPDTSVVDACWAIVARATVANELGTAAKVAPNDGTPARRLICVYTRDFRDRDDIARVLHRLRQLDLVKGAICYKCDALTYLGINSQNDWGIKASLYSSTDIFAYIEGKGQGS